MWAPACARIMGVPAAYLVVVFVCVRMCVCVCVVGGFFNRGAHAGRGVAATLSLLRCAKALARHGGGGAYGLVCLQSVSGRMLGEEG